MAYRYSKDVNEISASIRVPCPMQQKYINLKGKDNSCSQCPYLDKVIYVDWGAKVHCKYFGEREKHSFGDNDNNPYDSHSQYIEKDQ